MDSAGKAQLCVAGEGSRVSFSQLLSLLFLMIVLPRSIHRMNDPLVLALACS
jgi:hypothetical protein